jgi:hypothetical protein
MPRHYFNLDDTDHVSDPDGTELRDDTDAMAHATRVMRELMFQRRCSANCGPPGRCGCPTRTAGRSISSPLPRYRWDQQIESVRLKQISLRDLW